MRRLLLLAGLVGCALVAPGLAQAASPDGTGALAYTGGSVANPSTGNVLTFTFSLASGESLQEGELLITVPSGWSTPSTSSIDPGYTTSDCAGGFVDTTTFPGSIWIEGMNLSGPVTCTVTYGAAPGPGVSVPASTPGPAVFSTQTKGTLVGTFTPIASSPEVQVLAADGSGDLTSTSFPITNGSGDNGIEFDFSLGPDEDFDNGALQITVPAGWDPPSTNTLDGGYTTSDCGTVSAVGQVITVSGITLTGGDFCEVFYGDLPGPGVTAPTTGGLYSFAAETKATSGGTFQPLANAPEVQVLQPDGAGTMVSDTASVTGSSTGNTITFTYTAGLGGIFLGTVSVVVPPGWSAPSETGTDEGYVTADQPGGCGCPPFVSVVNRTIYADLFFLDTGETFTITYGDTSGGGSGATAPVTPGRYGWRTASQASCSCDSRLSRLAASPIVRVRSPDGTGTAGVKPTQVSADSTATIGLGYKPGPGGMEDGELQVAVPAGWTAPQTTTPGAPGYVTSSVGSVSTAGQNINITGVTLFGDTARIQYRGVVGPALGPQSFDVSQRGSSGGTLTPISSSPVVTVFAADGSGTMTTPTLTVPHGSTGNTVTFTYTAAAGGMSNGVVGLKIPAGWSTPSINSAAPGYVVADSGVVSIQGGTTIVVTGVNLGTGGILTITYGAAPSPGATAPSTVGPKTFSAYARSTYAGVNTQLAASPVIATT